jgi:parallel beta-helix repeat protein
MKTYVLIGLVVLMPLTALMAQSGQWQSMDGPYYIYNVTGISIGYQGDTYAYAVGSDLTHNYIYRYQGVSPIGNWTRVEPSIDGLKYVSASRYNGLKAYVATDENASSPLVKYSTDGGASWRPTNTPPANTAFTGIAAHPNSNQICFTSSKHVDGINSSIYKTENGGADWSATGTLPSDNDCNSICIDPNSGDQLDETTVYACFLMDQNNQGGGIYKSTNGGRDWTFLDLYGYNQSYTGIYVAVKKTEETFYQAIYAITLIDGMYDLWRADNENASWEWNPLNFTTVYHNLSPLFKVMAEDYSDQYGHYDRVYVVAQEGIYYSATGGNFIGVSSFPGEAGRFVPIKCADLDAAAQFSLPLYPDLLFFGSLYAISYLKDDLQSINMDEVTSGTNLMDVVSLDCLDNSRIRAMGRLGGYVSENPHIITEDYFKQEWGTTDCLMRYSDGHNVEGENIKCQRVSSPPDDPSYFIASGVTDQDKKVVIERGNIVAPIDEDEDPQSISALSGPLRRAAGLNCVVCDGHSKVWNAYGGYNYNVDYDMGNSPFPVKSLEYEWLSGINTNYYFCGDKGTGNNLAGFRFTSPTDRIEWLNTGLDLDNDTRANCIIKSIEDHPIAPQEKEKVIYLSTNLRIYKARFDFDNIDFSYWYPANYGIAAEHEIQDLTNYYSTIKYSIDYKPDSLVQYALGHDASDNPYIYISADSGRSWNEIGGYFRALNYQVNDLATFSDRRPNLGSMPVFLGVGTDNGVYRYPYNVKSGTLAEDETWGPGLIIVNGDVTVPVGSVLTILPGTTVKFVYNFDRIGTGSVTKSELIIKGKLKALGTASEPIVFMSSDPDAPEKGDWFTIFADTGSIDSLAYCIIKHADFGIKAYSVLALSIDHCTFEDNTTAGIYMNNAPSGTMIKNTMIDDCGNYGIGCNFGEFTAEKNTIQDCRYGIYYYGNGDPYLNGCTITCNPNLQSYFGIEILKSTTSPSPFIGATSITGFDQAGIFLNGISNSGEITNTTVTQSGVYGIRCKNSSPEINGG